MTKSTVGSVSPRAGTEVAVRGAGAAKRTLPYLSQIIKLTTEFAAQYVGISRPTSKPNSDTRIKDFVL